MITTIKDLGEIELLNRLKKFMRVGQIDDDIAEINSINKIYTKSFQRKLKNVGHFFKIF